MYWYRYFLLTSRNVHKVGDRKVHARLRCRPRRFDPPDYHPDETGL